MVQIRDCQNDQKTKRTGERVIEKIKQEKERVERQRERNSCNNKPPPLDGQKLAN